MAEQIEDIIKVSSKGQVVIPKEKSAKNGRKGRRETFILTEMAIYYLEKLRSHPLTT